LPFVEPVRAAVFVHQRVAQAEQLARALQRQQAAVRTLRVAQAALRRRDDRGGVVTLRRRSATWRLPDGWASWRSASSRLSRARSSTGNSSACRAGGAAGGTGGGAWA